MFSNVLMTLDCKSRRKKKAQPLYIIWKSISRAMYEMSYTSWFNYVWEESYKLICGVTIFEWKPPLNLSPLKKIEVHF